MQNTEPKDVPLSSDYYYYDPSNDVGMSPETQKPISADTAALIDASLDLIEVNTRIPKSLYNLLEEESKRSGKHIRTLIADSITVGCEKLSLKIWISK